MRKFFVDWLMLICTFNIILSLGTRVQGFTYFFRFLLSCMLYQCVIAISGNNIHVTYM